MKVLGALGRPLPAALAAAVLAGTAAPAAAQEPPRVRAPAATVVDAGSGEVLYERDAGTPRAIASATKLMTALLTLERVDGATVFTAVPYRASPVESKIGLRTGERITVSDLLTALLLESANDAAVTLAERVGSSRRKFVRAMNAKAVELGLEGTHYANPVGFDNPRNRSTAGDLAQLAVRLLRDPRFARTVNLERAELRLGTRLRTVVNRNRLIARVPFVDGVKTGHTRSAGYVLVGSASGRGAQVVSVVLGEPSEAARDADTLALLRWGLDRFRRVRVVRARTAVAVVRAKGSDARSGLVSRRPLAVTLRRGERPTKRVRAPREVEGPLPRGSRVGTVEVLHRGRVIARRPLVTAQALPAPGGPGALTWLGGAAMLAALGLGALRLRAVRMRRQKADAGPAA